MGKSNSKKQAGRFLPASVDGWIAEFGDDFGFHPLVQAQPSRFAPGSVDRVEEMRRRIRRGQPLFCKGDRVFHDGTTSEKFDQYATDPEYTTWNGDELKGSEFSECGSYRYRIWNTWDKKKPVVSFIGLHSESHPDGRLDRKLKALAIGHGCGGYQLLNLFAAKCDQPQDVWKTENPVGNANDRVIRLTVLGTSFTVCAWGRIGQHLARSAQVLAALQATLPKCQTYCYGLTEPVGGCRDDGRRYPYPTSMTKVEEDAKLMQIPWAFMDLGEYKKESKNND